VPVRNASRGWSRAELWSAVHTERAALVEDLQDLPAEQWRQPSLCRGWTVEDVVAHLVAAAGTGRLRWLRSVLGARFDADLHNERRLAEHRGSDPAATLDALRRCVTSTTAPSGHTPAWLGEVVVHGQDVLRPLGITRRPPVAAVTQVADFFVRRDFAVPSRSTARGLRLAATDGPFAAGDGPLVSGSTLALTMAMAGRGAFCDDLDGPGLAVLRERCATVS